jgi:hypothetical protein
MLTYEEASGSSPDSTRIADPPAVEQVRPTLDGEEPGVLDGTCTDCEEMLIVDCRADLGPAQWVEHKLSSLLNGGPLPVSHARMRRHWGTRNHC